MSEPVRLVPDAERRARMARRHGIAPQHRLADPVAATRAMTVLHSTEPPTPYLSVHARVDGVTRADVDAGALRRPHPGQAAGDAPHPVRLPARPAARGVGERLGPGRRHRAAPDRQGRGAGRASPRTATPGSTPPAPRAGAPAGTTRRASPPPTSAGCSPSSPRTVEVSAGSRWNHTRRLLTHLGLTADLVRGRQRRALAHLATRVGADGATGWRSDRRRCRSRRATPCWCGAGCAPSGPAPRPTWCGGWARPRPPYAARSPTSAPSRWRWSRATPGWLLPDDLEPEAPVEPWAALLPVLDPTLMGWKQRDWYLDPTHVPVPLRHQRQRRHHRLVGRPRRRLLRPGRRRRRARWCCARTRAPGPGRPRRRGRAAHRLAGRRVGQQRLRLTPDARGAAALTAGRARFAGLARLACARHATPGSPAAAAPRPAPPGALRQARPAALHQPPRLQPRLRARRLPRPRPDGLLVGLQPAPADLLRRRRPDRVGQRGGVPRDRARRGARPGGGARAARRVAARRASTSSRSSSRPAARWPTCSRPAAGASTCDADPAEVVEAAVARVPGRRRGARGADDQEGAARVRRARRAVVSLAVTPSRADDGPPIDVVLRHGVPAVRPDDVLDRAGRRSRTSRPAPAPLMTRLAQGPLLGGRRRSATRFAT